MSCYLDLLKCGTQSAHVSGRSGTFKVPFPLTPSRFSPWPVALVFTPPRRTQWLPRALEIYYKLLSAIRAAYRRSAEAHIAVSSCYQRTWILKADVADVGDADVADVDC
ncbi:hypothetical protein ACLKA7_004580 [Drosophila subpalustris]